MTQAHETNPMKHIFLYSDGSCLGNPGPGGWAALLRLATNGHERILSGGFAHTTNNRMEIVSVIEGLRALTQPCRVDVYSDSQYVCNAVNKGWLYAWKKSRWVKSDKKPVKNRDLWEQMLPLLARHDVHFHWIRGHTGHAENEQCDALAREQAQRSDLPPDTGMETYA